MTTTDNVILPQMTTAENTWSFETFAAGLANGRIPDDWKTITQFVVHADCASVEWEPISSALHERAEAGDAIAQVYVGLMCRYGKGCGSNTAEALRWFEKSAAQNCAWGCFYVGVCLYHDLDANEQNREAAALPWFVKAADQDNVFAMTYLGAYYSFGYGGVGKDKKRALALYRVAAAAGEPDAQYRLAVFHCRGLAGLPKDERLAFEWFLKSAQQDHELAMFNVGLHYVMYRQGHSTEENDREARPWFEKSALCNVVGAQHAMGVFYEEGRGGCVKDFSVAYSWYEKAANRNHSPAEFTLGRIHSDGLHVPQDDLIAVQWFMRCIEHSQSYKPSAYVGLAYYYVGLFHEQGRGGLEKDEALAMYMFERGAHVSNVSCTYKLAKCYEAPGEVHDALQAAKLYSRCMDFYSFSSYRHAVRSHLRRLLTNELIPALSPVEQIAWCMRANICIGDDPNRSAACVALLHLLLLRAAGMTRVLRTLPTSPLYGRSLCKELFITNILAPACVYYNADANMTIAPPMDALRRAYELGMDRALLQNRVMTRAVWTNYLLDAESALIVVATLCTSEKCVQFGNELECDGDISSPCYARFFDCDASHIHEVRTPFSKRRRGEQARAVAKRIHSSQS